MVRAKLATAAVVLPLVLVFLYWGGWPLFLFALAFMLVGLHEFYSAVTLRGIAPVWEWGVLAGFGILAATQWAPEQYRSGIVTACIAGVVFAALIAQFWRKQGTSVINNAGATVFGVVYVALLFSYYLRLRQLSLAGIEGIPLGGVRDRMGIPFLVLAAVWLNDAAANLAGRAFGRLRPWTGISPNKSIEGCLAGLLASMVATLAIGCGLCHLPVLAMLLLGAIIGVIVEVGDLCGSLIKRDLGLKDFGSALPGHGGVLDRFDSLVFAMPVAYYYLDYLLRPWF